MGSPPSDSHLKISPSPTTPWPGRLLRAVRESKGLSLEAVSEMTRIRRGMLEWIESDAFDQLPAPVYTRGLILQIAKALSLPEDEVVQSYSERMKSP
jgi:cytoskeletal protein RodZ